VTKVIEGYARNARFLWIRRMLQAPVVAPAPCLTAALALSLTPLVGLAGPITTFNFTGGVQTFNANGDYYVIEAVGASGGNSTSGKNGGYGAFAQGYFSTNPGETYHIIVGGEGTNGTGTDGGGGGGGGSFVYSSDPQFPELAAGGGGGAGSIWSGVAGNDGSTGRIMSWGTNPHITGGPGGTTLSGVGVLGGLGGGQGFADTGAGGAGTDGNGDGACTAGGGCGGVAIYAGGAGGNGGSSCCSFGGMGGFGGGGGGGEAGAGGGGGGFSGGGGGDAGSGGGGGGSIVQLASYKLSVNTQAGNGMVLIEDTGSSFNADYENNFIMAPGDRPPAPTPEPSSQILLGIGLLAFATLAATKKRKRNFPFGSRQ
jgi:PEP-CTERM motif